MILQFTLRQLPRELQLLLRENMDIKLNNKKLLSVTTALKIKDMIIQQNLKPGDKLPNETQLSKYFNVSRLTLREAMKTLKAQNIVVIRQGDGTYISDGPGMGEDPLGLRFFEKEILANGIFEARLLIEPQIAMLAATRATNEEIEKIGDIVEKMKNINYLSSDRVELDMHFHTMIAKCSKNPVFINLVPVIFETIEKGIIILFNSEESYNRSLRAHEEIYNALKQKDICRIQSAVSAHIYNSLDDIKHIKRPGRYI